MATDTYVVDIDKESTITINNLQSSDKEVRIHRLSANQLKRRFNRAVKEIEAILVQEGGEIHNKMGGLGQLILSTTEAGQSKIGELNDVKEIHVSRILRP